MKKIYLIITALVILISWMVYLYFSSLNKNSNQSDQSLRLVSREAGMIFSFQQDKSVLDILKGQELFNKLIGTQKTEALKSLQESMGTPFLNSMIQSQQVYIGFYPGKQRNLEFMLAVMINPEIKDNSIITRIQKNKIDIKPIGQFYEFGTMDGIKFYLTLKDRVLVVASAPELILGLENPATNDNGQSFLNFIQKNDRLAKNSLASLYLNFKRLPGLMKSVTPYFNRGDLAQLNQQNGYARLSYNFSKEKVFFSGETKVENANSYFSLFQSIKPEKIIIDKILPDNTASYTLYSFGNIKSFNTGLRSWFKAKKEDEKIQKQIEALNQKYRLNLDGIFPVYSGTQGVTFQLQDKQKLAAINLVNGDKVGQLLLDLSEDYDGDIRLFKEADLLYYYFGEPFKSFKRPYYVIMDNHIIFAPYASSLMDFKNKYQANKLLILEDAYAEVYSQLPLTSNILFYLNNKRAQNIVVSTIYPEFYNHYRKNSGLNEFDSFVYQLGGDTGSFQTNILFSTDKSLQKPGDEVKVPDSLNQH